MGWQAEENIKSQGFKTLIDKDFHEAGFHPKWYVTDEYKNLAMNGEKPRVDVLLGDEADEDEVC